MCVSFFISSIRYIHHLNLNHFNWIAIDGGHRNLNIRLLHHIIGLNEWVVRFFCSVRLMLKPKWSRGKRARSHAPYSNARPAGQWCHSAGHRAPRDGPSRPWSISRPCRRGPRQMHLNRRRRQRWQLACLNLFMNSRNSQVGGWMYY